MNIFVRAVITGFGMSVGKFLFDEIKERVLGKEEDSRPQHVVVDNVSDFNPPDQE